MLFYCVNTSIILQKIIVFNGFINTQKYLSNFFHKMLNVIKLISLLKFFRLWRVGFEYRYIAMNIQNSV